MSEPLIPSRLLFDPNKKTQFEYVHSSKTDIRVRFAEARAAMQPASTKNVSNLPKRKAK